MTASKGYGFREMKKITKDWQTKGTRLVYGTRTGKFHFIDKKDRDYNTPFSVTPKQFQQFSTKHWAKEYLIRPMLWNIGKKRSVKK